MINIFPLVFLHILKSKYFSVPREGEGPKGSGSVTLAFVKVTKTMLTQNKNGFDSYQSFKKSLLLLWSKNLITLVPIIPFLVYERNHADISDIQQQV